VKSLVNRFIPQLIYYLGIIAHDLRDCRRIQSEFCKASSETVVPFRRRIRIDEIH
jgi:hypothetical protein